MISNLQEYFERLGFSDDDTIAIDVKPAKAGRWQTYIWLLGEVLAIGSDAIFAADSCVYYACASFQEGSRNRKKESVKSVKELVIDIDFKAIDFEDRDNAEKLADVLVETLPEPTVKVHSGNGLHLHYALIDSAGNPGVDKDDFESVYKRVIEYFNSQFPNHIDKSVWGCNHLFRLPFSHNCKDVLNPKPVTILASSCRKYTLADFAALIPSEIEMPLLSRTEEVRHTIRAVSRRELTKCGIDRSKAIFAIVNRVMELFPTAGDTTLISVIKEFPELTERYKNDDKMREDVRRIMIKSHSAITSILPVETMRLIDGYQYDIELGVKRELFDKNIFSTLGTNESKFDAMLQIYDRLFDDAKSGIISVPCSSSKTFSALIYVSSIADRLKQYHEKIWFVSEKIDDCRRNAEVLTALGARAIAYHGQPQSCNVQRREFLAGQPCKSCETPCGAVNRYLHGLAVTLNKCEVLCCTHKFFANELAKGNDPNATLIVIDESPSLLESYELDSNTVSTIKDHLSRATYLDTLFEHELRKIKDVCIDKGTYRIEPLELDDFTDSIKLAHMNAQRGYSGSIEKLESVLGFFTFFNYSDNVFGTKIGDGHFKFLAGKIDISLPNSIVWILDGSAKNQLTKWQDMTVIEVPDLQVSFPNLKVNLIPGNSTKSALGRTRTRRALVDSTSKIPAGNTILFSNKTPDGDALKTVDDVASVLTAKGNTIINMTRGEHIGSNKGRAANSNLICMSLFSDVADYALRASIYYNREFRESDLYGTQISKDGTEFQYVRMNNGGFENLMLRNIMTRSIERDLYQAIMRGVIRDNPQADYTVVAIVSDQAIITTLAEDLPEATITCQGQEIIELWLSGMANKDIAVRLGITWPAVSKAVDRFTREIGLD